MLRHALLRSAGRRVVCPCGHLTVRPMAFKRSTRKSKTEDPPSADNEMSLKERAVEDCVKALQDKFGRGIASRMSDTYADPNIKRISTGAMTLDIALGGGLPRGRIVEIFGPESTGKTTLALCAMVQAQKAGGSAVLVDAENAFDPSYGKKLGLDVQKLWIVQPDDGDQALETVDMLCRSGGVDIITVDSVAALIPRAELEKDIGDPTIGLQARMMSSGLRRIAGSASKSGTTVIFINQLRMKIGVMFGNPETTPGGMALKYYASQRIDVRKGKQIDSGNKDEPAKGLNVKAKVVKNKTGAPYGSVTFDILFDRGIDVIGCMLDAAVKAEVVDKRGSHHYFTNSTGEIKLGNGRDNAITFLENNPEVKDEIEALTRERISTVSPVFGSVDEDDAEDGMEFEASDADGDVPAPLAGGPALA